MKNFDTKFYYELTEIALEFIAMFFTSMVTNVILIHKFSALNTFAIPFCITSFVAIYRVRQLIRKYL